MKKLMLLIVIVTLAVCSYPAYANEWIACAGEGQDCMVPGTKMVRYGAGERWALKKATNRISCSNSVFGDPAPGAGKSCYYQDAQQSDKGFRQPSGHDDSRQDHGVRSGHDNRPQDRWVRCANEGGYCKFNGQRDIRYGAGDRWNYQSARNGISCSYKVFGDPAVGVVKACYYQEDHRSDKGWRPPSGHEDSRQDRWVRCANEGGYCKFHGQRDIRYGAGDRWNYQSARNSIACNNGVFGDPAPGVGKACFYEE